jgi:hypothetical protein
MTKLELQHPEPSHATHYSPRGDLRSQAYPTAQPLAPLAGSELQGFDNVDITVPPSALTSATAYSPHRDSPSPLEDYPRARSHQRNLTGTFFDNISSTIQQHTSSAASIRSHSPTKSLASFIPSRSAIESTASSPKIKALQNWFNGSSAPVKLGVQQHQDDSASNSECSESGSETGSDYDSDEEEEEHGSMNIFNRISNTRAASESPSRSNDAPAPAQTQSQSAASSRFAWLLSTQKNAVIPHSTKSPTYHNADDELLNLNISQALFPHGPADPLAPSSFNDLLTNAEALLSRYQKSYRQLSTALVDAHSEQSAQDDELDEAETRARHLKMQLETMAARATEQDEQMRNLMEDLAFERRARQEEEAARTRNMALIRAQPQCACADSPRRRNRVSNSHVSIDSGFESECDTDAASVFSRTCLSPTGTDQSSILEAESLDSTPKARSSQLLQRGSTYEKPRGSVTLQVPVNLQAGGWGCANCEGGKQVAVWGRLAKEREENRSLRSRVETLEEAVESALDVVGGAWTA